VSSLAEALGPPDLYVPRYLAPRVAVNVQFDAHSHQSEGTRRAWYLLFELEYLGNLCPQFPAAALDAIGSGDAFIAIQVAQS
jgi:hypothetical protein